MTASISPSVTTMAPQGETTTIATSATSTAPHPADADKGGRFAEVLSRKLKTGGQESDEADKDAAFALVPNANALAATNQAAMVATSGSAGLTTQATAQDTHQNQGIDSDAFPNEGKPADTAMAQTPSSAQSDAGRILRFVPRMMHGATPDDGKPASAGSDTDAVEGWRNDPIDTLDGVLQHIHTANRLMGAGKAQAGTKSLADPATPAHASPSTWGNATTLTETSQSNTRALTQILARSTTIAANHNDSALANASLSVAQALPASHTSPSGVLAAADSMNAIPVPLNHPQWSQALSQQMLRFAHANAQGLQVAELRLDPPELGPLRIAIELRDHVAHAAFVSAHAPVRLAIENALPQLHEQLAQAGISLGQTSVSDQGSPGQEAAGYDDALATAMAAETAQATHTAPAVVLARNPHALIDTFA